MKTSTAFFLSLLFSAPLFAASNLESLREYIQQHGIAGKDSVTYASTILSVEDEFNIAADWYGAMLCQENGFKAQGTDGRGSFSISQMQVQTAQIVARHLHEPWKQITPEWMESHPLKMIRYGAKHFHDLLREFHGNYALATRAYNAGSTRIHYSQQGSKKWKNLSKRYYNDVLRRYQILRVMTGDK